MCVYRQHGKWWYEFTIGGHRIRQSSRSSDRDLALLIEAEHRRALELGTGGASPILQALKAEEKAELQGVEVPGNHPKTKRTVDPNFSPQPVPTRDMRLREAGELYIRNRQDRKMPKTQECDVGALRNLLRFFGDMPLLDFHIGHLENYQKGRGRDVGASAINHEIGLLARLLKEAKLWSPIHERYHPLREAAWKPPKIFTREEQALLFKKLKGNPELELAEIVFTITRNTTASGCELRGLRLQNLELEADPPRFSIPPDSTKNNIRPRTIALNRTAADAFRRAIERANRLGSNRPEHFLFPFRVNRALYDPNRRASKSWLSRQTTYLRELTGIEHINPHVFRHLAVTELLENGAKEQTVIEVAGWVSRKMIETYSHARIEAKADAVNLLDGSAEKKTQRPPKRTATPAPASPSLMDPAIQAEIARQVALALQQQEQQRLVSETRPVAKGPRLITFPQGRSLNGGTL